MGFRYKTRREYEEDLDRILSSCCWDPYCPTSGSDVSTVDYEELVDEYVEFCEVSGSGERSI